MLQIGFILSENQMMIKFTHLLATTGIDL